MIKPSIRLRLKYDDEDDTFEMMISDDNCYARILDSGVTVFCRASDHAVIGILIEGVSRLFKEKS
jgi:hypothetical protein